MLRKASVFCVSCALILGSAAPARAHVGSPDVYAEGSAGPYKLFIVVRPPLVIPGVADIEVRSSSRSVHDIKIAPMLLTGEASKHPPVPDDMKGSSNDSQFFTGHLWIMQTGSWQVRFVVRGAEGQGVLSIPVPAAAMVTRKMQRGLGFMLGILGILLIAGMVGIVGAAIGEAHLRPGELAKPDSRKHVLIAMSIATLTIVLVTVLGGTWWNVEAADYASNIYKPLNMHAELEHGDVLSLKITDPGWIDTRKVDDFVLDHNHLMHLYVIRWPSMDVIFHLHPDQVGDRGGFRLAMPSMPAGNYRLYADVVHADGFPETLATSIALPLIPGHTLSGDDAEAEAVALGGEGGRPLPTDEYELHDGYKMIWARPSSLTAKTPVEFSFRLNDPRGNPPKDMALYMGMAGHAAFVKTDGSVFAHIHPSGTVSMAAFDMAQAQNADKGGLGTVKNMPGMNMLGTETVPNAVSFPYGFPSAGNYRIIVQMKHGSVIESGIFDAEVH